MYIIGVAATNKTFTLCYCFMRIETRKDYMWALEKLRSFFLELGILEDITFVTDRELALMSALAEIFPKSTALLCRWHINKNIFAK